MESIARSYLDKGDVAAAAKLLTSLELSQPKVVPLAKRCRVLADPLSVPVPHRYTDMADAILDSTLPLEAYFGSMGSEEDTLQRFNKLLLLVHPDKNPCKRASEAFVRLRTLKDKALQHVSDKKAAHAQHAVESAQYEKLRSTPPPVQASLSSSRRQDPKKASSRRSTSSGHPLNTTGVNLTSRPQATELPPIDSSYNDDAKSVFLSTRSLGGGASNAASSSMRSRLPAMRDIVLTSLTRPAPSLRTEGGPRTTPPSTQQTSLMDSMRSELLRRKEISLKLSCTFDATDSFDDDATTAQMGNGNTASASSLPHTATDASITPVYNGEGDGDSDDDDETLFCTVRSTLSVADTTGSQSPLRSTKVIASRESSFYVKPACAAKCQSDVEQVLTDRVVAQGISTQFTANALASLQAAWSGYRRRQSGKDETSPEV